MNSRFVKAFCFLVTLFLLESTSDRCQNCDCFSFLSTETQFYCSPTPCTCSPTSTKTATSPETIVGAVLGGAICGSAVTVVVFMCMCRKSSVKKTKKTLFGKAKPVRQFIDGNQQKTLRDLNTKSVVYNEINDDLQRVVQPMQHQEASCIKEGVYNHLHTPYQEDRSDYYDHAGPTPSLPNIEEGYGVLPVDSKRNENYNNVATTPDCDEPMASEYARTSIESNEYFTLERMNNC